MPVLVQYGRIRARDFGEGQTDFLLYYIKWKQKWVFFVYCLPR